jgi:DNA-directed RNA polymerase specialized sigma subunit
MKYGGNMPASVARAEAERLAVDAMKKYTPSKGNIKTYLSGQLKKLSRIGYKASTVMNIPESRLLNRAKVRDFIDEHKSTFGYIPSPKDIAQHIGTSESDAFRYLDEMRNTKTESAFENIHGSSFDTAPHDVVGSISPDLVGIAEDIYLKGLSNDQVMRKRKLKRATFFNKKKKIDLELKSQSGLANIVTR